MNRRHLLAGLAVAGAAAPVLLAQPRMAFAAVPEIGPMPDPAGVRTAADYFKGVLPRAELSLVTSQEALGKASNADAREFSGFELSEAILVNKILKDMDVEPTGLGADAEALLSQMKAAGGGASFDRAYIGFQLANHEYLRNLADGYLNNSVASSDPAEKHGRHLATLMLGNFKEHTAICKRISAALGA